MKLSVIGWAGRLPGLLGIERRRAGRGTRPITLNQRRIFILPTGYGLLYGAMVGVMTFTSANYNNNMGFVLAFTLASLGMVAVLHTYRNMAQLTLRPGRAPAVFCGETAHFNLLVDNQSRQPRSSVFLETAGQPPTLTDITANGTETVQLTVPTARRGLLTLDIITVSSSYPLGLFRAWSYVRLDMRCVVYPRPLAHGSPPAGHGAEPGTQSSYTRGMEDFVGLRTYTSGDSLRHVHWKALAREQTMMTKQFGDNTAEVVWLDWASLGGLDTEARLSVLCRWVLEAADVGLRYGLRLPGQVIAPDHGTRHRHQCLQALALFGDGRD
jgi:uncharacterized protein (DUF58 family)